MAQSSYQLINLTSDIVLTWPFSFLSPPTVADINDISPNQAGWTIAMPDATLAPVGQNVVFNNVSAFSFQIVANDLITVIATITAGEVATLYLYDNTTVPATNGLWRVIPFGGGTNAITALTAQSTNSSVTITNGVITPPGGVINFQLPTSLTNLNTTISSIGFAVITGLSPLTWTTVDFLSDSNISITHPDGTTGNPVVSLASTIGPITSLIVGNLTLSGDIITNNTTNGNIQLSTNGTGQVQINGVSTDINGNLTGINNLTVNGTFNNPFTPKAWGVFTDTIFGTSNLIVIQTQANVASITGGAGTYTINFTTPMSSINYGVFITLGSTGGSLPFISNAYWIVRQTTSVTIIVTDASGELVLSAPYGVSVMIMSN
jgi:hypothetical protein